jgi:membrane protease YdiL (CAAX protease family)
MTKTHPLKILIALLFLVILFHLGIILKIIPYTIAWGGRLTTDSEMYVFETISILINAFLGWVLLMKGSFVKFRFSARAIHVILWIFFALFVLNTVGNSLAKTNTEKYFAILTGLFALLLWRIIKQKQPTNR